MTDVLQLHTLLGDYANTAALKKGMVASPRLCFDFSAEKLPQNAFKAVVRGEFDVAELAIVTYLQALAHGKPLVLLPAVVMAISPHPCLAYNTAQGVLRPNDLQGRRIGIRAQQWLAEEMLRLLQKSAAQAADMPGADCIQSGIEALRPTLDLIIHYAFRQQLIPRRFAVDELFNM